MQHDRATAPSLGDQAPHIYKKGPPFGMPGVHVDGMDVLAVHEAASEAVARGEHAPSPPSPPPARCRPAGRLLGGGADGRPVTKLLT